MSEQTDHDRGEKGLSAGHLALVFLAGVAVCGVFFSLGFLVGYNERSSKTAMMSEQVPQTGAVPPLINRVPETASATTEARRAGSTNSTENLPTAATNKSILQADSPKTPTPPRPKDNAPASSGQEVGAGFTVQVAASRNKQDADALVKILKSRNYPVFLVSPEYARAADNLYRVQVGPFRTREDADKMKQKLTQEGFKPFVRR